MVEIKQSIDIKAVPIKVYSTDFKISDKDILKLKTLGYNQSTKLNIGGAKLSNSTNIFKHKFLSPVKKFIDNMANTYAKDVLGIDNKLVRVVDWSALSRKGSQHHDHRHPNCLFSLVYYARIKSGALKFWVDKSSLENIFFFDYKIKQYNIYNSTSWCIQPEEGDVVIFPGDVRHGSDPNEHDEDRIIIGANYFITGEIGNEPYTKHVIK